MLEETIKNFHCESKYSYSNFFLTYEIEFIPFLVVLENSVLPMG